MQKEADLTWFSPKQAAAEAGRICGWEVSEDTIRNWIESGVLKAFQTHPHGRVRIYLKDLQEVVGRQAS